MNSINPFEHKKIAGFIIFLINFFLIRSWTFALMGQFELVELALLFKRRRLLLVAVAEGTIPPCASCCLQIQPHVENVELSACCTV